MQRFLRFEAVARLHSFGCQHQALEDVQPLPIVIEAAVHPVDPEDACELLHRVSVLKVRHCHLGCTSSYLFEEMHANSVAQDEHPPVGVTHPCEDVVGIHRIIDLIDLDHLCFSLV